MRIGLQVPSFTWPGGASEIGARFAEIARTADDAGFASFWVMDHFFQIPMVGPAEREMLESYSALSFAAAITKRVALGAMVTGVTYRHPGVLVKTATTLDVLSGGRAYLGIGAAWFDREHAGLGVPFPPLAERFERLEETLRVAHQMWSPENGPFAGRHFKLAETLCSPAPVSSPRPRILIGGLGEKKTLRFVARYADACNMFAFLGPEGIAKKLDVLRRHCDVEKRDFASIEKTTLGTAWLAPGKQSAASVIASCRALAAIGVQQAIFNLPNVHELAPLEVFGKEIIPAVAGF
jgi:F420-dependent oxidoreductase-like protein